MFFSKKIKKSKITSERAKELLIDLQEPKTKEEIEYINKLVKNQKEFFNKDLFSPELLEERLEIVKGKRRVELWDGAPPKNKEEEQYIKEYNEYQEKSKKESENYSKRYENTTKEIIALLKKYNYTDYLPGHKFNNPIFNRRFDRIEDKALDLAIKKCIEKYDRYSTSLINEEIVPIKQKLLKEKYGYDWCPEGDNYCKEFWDEYNKILDKYNMKFVDFLDNRR